MNEHFDRPVIGITYSASELIQFVLWRHFFHAFVAAGATPVLIDCAVDQPGIDSFVGRLDGLVISGGGDVDPVLYGADRGDSVVRGVNPVRDANERRALDAALERGMPILAICRGLQAVNVALGGTLHLDLARERPTGVVHRESEEALSRPLHEVEVRAGSLLSRWIGVHGVVPVNSEHHQGISVLAPALTPVAFSSDGLVEGAESIEHNIVGVQWHPEILWPHEPCSAALLQGFVADCQARMPAGRLSE